MKSRKHYAHICFCLILLNRAFSAGTPGYGWVVGRLLRASLLVSLAYGGQLNLTYMVFTRAPTGFVLQQDQGRVFATVQLPDPSFQWNILNYGRILNNVQAQNAQFQALVTAYQNTVLTAAQEVENGLVTFLESQAQVKFLAESVKAAEKAVTVALAQYKGGTVDFNRVALVEQNLVVQQNLLAQAQGSISLGLIQVYRALGGGWQIRLTGCESMELPPPGTPRPEELPAPRPLTGSAPGFAPPADALRARFGTPLVSR